MKPRLAAALALLALWHLALRHHGFFLPMMSDEGEYALQARVISDGGAPYRDAYNQKPPLVFLLYRLSFALFGPADWSPRFLAVGVSWAVLAMLWALTPESWSWAARLAAPGAFAALSTLPIGDFGFAANTEIFTAGLSCASALALARSFHFAAGLFMGAALMTKQTAVWTALAFLALSARRGRFLAGTAVVPAGVLGFLASRGCLSDFFDQVFARNMDYASVLLATSSAWSQLKWFLTTEAPLFLRGAGPALALAAWGLAKTRLEPGRRFELLATLWLGGALVGAATGLFFFPHYFLPAAPPLALAAALGVERLRRRREAALAVLCLWPALAFLRVYFLASPAEAAKTMLYPNPLYEALTAGAYINEHSRPEDKIYVFGSEPQIYVYAQRRPATRHDFVFPLTLFPKGRAEIAAELGALAGRPPKFIAYVNLDASTMVSSRLGEDFREGVRRLIAERYRWSGRIDILPEGPALWQPADAAGPDWSRPSLLLFERKDGLL